MNSKGRKRKIMFTKGLFEMAHQYMLPVFLPPELKVLILEFSSHLRRGARSLCWFLWA